MWVWHGQSVNIICKAQECLTYGVSKFLKSVDGASISLGRSQHRLHRLDVDEGCHGCGTVDGTVGLQGADSSTVFDCDAGIRITITMFPCDDRVEYG
jgi:hypothetical protein